MVPPKAADPLSYVTVEQLERKKVKNIFHQKVTAVSE